MNNFFPDKFEFGRCKKCYKELPLKNGYCIDCKNNLPDILKDIFNPFNNKGNEND